MVIQMKKGQLKIQQMVFMLLAITLFFFLVGMIVLTMSLSGLRERAEAMRQEDAILLASKIADSPEFSCGNSYGTAMSLCIDFEKVIHFQPEGNIAFKYSDFWDVSGMEIRKIYPKNDVVKECNLDNYPNCEIISIVKGDGTGTSYSSFVSLCRRDLVKDERIIVCELAKIIITAKEI